MTPEERQALREKHQPSEVSCNCCGPICLAEDCSIDWPCDVIKVLDATEQFYEVRPIIDEGLAFGETTVIWQWHDPNWEGKMDD